MTDLGSLAAAAAAAGSLKSLAARSGFRPAAMLGLGVLAGIGAASEPASIG
jgi:hypothetical protein